MFLFLAFFYYVTVEAICFYSGVVITGTWTQGMIFAFFMLWMMARVSDEEAR